MKLSIVLRSCSRAATRRIASALVAAGLVVLSGASAAAQSTAPTSGKWEFEGEVYLWGASLSSETITGDKVDVGFDTVLSDLNIGVMGAVAARRDRFALFADLIYLNVEDDQSTTASIVGFPITVSSEVDLQGVISTFGGGYQLANTDQAEVYGVLGGRLLWLDADLEFRVNSLDLNASDSSTNLDAIAGVRGKFDLSDNWYLVGYGDLGTGQSDFTWQAWGTINYRWDPVTITAGYRYMSWDFDSDADLLSELDLHGPIAGVKFNF